MYSPGTVETTDQRLHRRCKIQHSETKKKILDEVRKQRVQESPLDGLLLDEGKVTAECETWMGSRTSTYRQRRK